jgi:hypothetical protein
VDQVVTKHGFNGVSGHVLHWQSVDVSVDCGLQRVCGSKEKHFKHSFWEWNHSQALNEAAWHFHSHLCDACHFAMKKIKSAGKVFPFPYYFLSFSFLFSLFLSFFIFCLISFFPFSSPSPCLTSPLQVFVGY